MFFSNLAPLSNILVTLLLFQVSNTDDDQLYYTKIFLNEELRQKYKIKLDNKAEIFQNLNGAVCKSLIILFSVGPTYVGHLFDHPLLSNILVYASVTHKCYCLCFKFYPNHQMPQDVSSIHGFFLWNRLQLRRTVVTSFCVNFFLLCPLPFDQGSALSLPPLCLPQ